MLDSKETKMAEPQEQLQELPQLELSKSNNWRDWLYNLQVASTILPDEPKERSSNLGLYGHNIILNTIYGLREKRVDGQGRPYILLIDEIEDETVVAKATPQERVDFFLEAVVDVGNEFWVETEKERLEDFATSSLAMGIALTGKPLQEVKKLLLQNFRQGKIRNGNLKRGVLRELEVVDPKRVEKIVDYLKFSQDQMTLKEQSALQRKFQEEKPLGSEPVNIEGQEFGFVGVGHPVYLTERDLENLDSLRKAVRVSRDEVVKQAKLLAERLFKVQNKDIYNPPEWWIKGSNSQGLKSTEFLLFIPNLNEFQGSLPDYILDIYNLYERSGWFHLEINEKDYGRPIVIRAGLLH